MDGNYGEQRLFRLDRTTALGEIVSGQPNRMARGILSIAAYDRERSFAEAVCVRYSRHADEQVRGQAVRGLGLVARAHGRVDEGRAATVLNRALTDPSDFVRQEACQAMDQITSMGGESGHEDGES